MQQAIGDFKSEVHTYLKYYRELSAVYEHQVLT